jgi:integrase
MKFVEPIRDLRKISQIKNMLRGENKIRELLLFELGINSALRLSDLLVIQVKDVFDTKGDINDFFDIKEEKTNKANRITITPKVKQTLELFKEVYPHVTSIPHNYLFFHTKKAPIGAISIGRKQAWKMISYWTKEIGLKGNYGGHSLRKTWGYQARLQNVPLEIIQHKLNHSSLAVTQRYLGITADEIMEACNKLDL